MNRLALLLIAGVIIAPAFAGTVTLTGTCPSMLTNSTINFSLLNSGTDPAANLVIEPFSALSGPSPYLGYYYANQINPEQQRTFAMNSSIGPRVGTFIYYFITTYQEGTDIFTVVFPCEVKNTAAYPSMIGIDNASAQSVNSSAVKISGSIYSFSSNAINGNITAIVPPEFRGAAALAQAFSINPYQYRNFTFYANYPNTKNSTYSGAVALEYTENGINYASLSVISIKPYRSTQSDLTAYAPQLAAAAVIAVIIMLIARQRIIKRKKAK